MTIIKKTDGSNVTLALEGWLDTQASPMLLEELDHLEDGISSMVLDFSGLEYISSTGVRAVVLAYKKMHGALVVKGASPSVFNIFRSTGIDKNIPFE